MVPLDDVRPKATVGVHDLGCGWGSEVGDDHLSASELLHNEHRYYLNFNVSAGARALTRQGGTHCGRCRSNMHISRVHTGILIPSQRVQLTFLYNAV